MQTEYTLTRTAMNVVSVRIHERTSLFFSRHHSAPHTVSGGDMSLSRVTGEPGSRVRRVFYLALGNESRRFVVSGGAISHFPDSAVEPFAKL